MAVTLESLSPLHRRLIPGIADLFFAFFFLSQIGGGLFSDADTGWHLWAGTEFLRHGPRVLADTLSFTRAGAPWMDLQWLGDAVLALAYRHGAYVGLAVLVSLVFAATFTWAYRIGVRDSDDPPAAVAVTSIAALASLMQLLARPLVFSFPLFLGVRELTRDPKRARLAAVAVPVLTALWANLHPSAFLAPLLAGFAWSQRRGDRSLAIATLGALVALGVTPWGFAWLADLAPRAGHLQILTRLDEWHTPNFSQPRFWFTYLFLGLALVARTRGPRLAPGEAWFGVACLLGALAAARNVPLAVLAWTPYAARDLSALLSAHAERGPGRIARAWRETTAPFERAFRPGLWPALMGFGLLIAAPALGPVFPEAARGFPASELPTEALAHAAPLGLGPRVLADYGWSGYVSWATQGRTRVFIDGRAGFFPDDVFRDYVRITRVRPGWGEALARRRPDWMLVPSEGPLVQAATGSGGWVLAYSDSLAAILTPARR